MLGKENCRNEFEHNKLLPAIILFCSLGYGANRVQLASDAVPLPVDASYVKSTRSSRLRSHLRVDISADSDHSRGAQVRLLSVLFLPAVVVLLHCSVHQLVRGF